ncbi:hypothetical protein ACQ4PT_011561 [Festuca glaucescens]
MATLMKAVLFPTEGENGAELFYYFIESEGDPRRDPLVVWLPGGGRCTVQQALLLQFGPLKFIIEPYDGSTVPRLRYHPYSWTRAASILFVDSPVGAGFSFSRNIKGYDVGEASAALQVKTFLAKWFTEHPNYLTNPFYVGGASRGGRIAPFLAQKISEDIEAGMTPTVNLKGYLVGNPATGEAIDRDTRVPYLHGVGVISDQLYELYDQTEGKHILYKKCHDESSGPIHMTTERNILKEETGVLRHPPPRPSLDCQSYGKYLSYYWSNNNITRESLGIKKGSKDEWTCCDENDLPYFPNIKSSIKYHHNMTSKGYRVLVYSGDHDAVIPFFGTQSWVRSLNFPISDEWSAWHLKGQSAGFTLTYTINLTFATVNVTYVYRYH